MRQSSSSSSPFALAVMASSVRRRRLQRPIWHQWHHLQHGTITQSSHNTNHLLTLPCLLYRWLEQALQQVLARSLPSSGLADSSLSDALPNSPANLVPLHATYIQHRLVQQAAQIEFNAALNTAQRKGIAGTAVVAHLNSITAEGAATWKSVIPSSREHTLTDSQYAVAARLSLRLPPYRNRLVGDCRSCHQKGALDADAWHHLSCNGHKGQEISLRHHSIVNVLHSHATQCGSAVREPTGLSSEDGKRPDLQLTIPGQSILSDVVVSHPLCKAHLARAVVKPLATAEDAATSKHRKYRQLAQQQHSRFIPFSVETTGGRGKDAEQLIEQISLVCKDHFLLPSHEQITNAIRSSVAIAIQRGNALAVFGGYSRAVMRAGMPHIAA